VFESLIAVYHVGLLVNADRVHLWVVLVALLEEDDCTALQGVKCIM
jgi:hypothetical protein